jgi:ankyrin repeat protein
MRSITCQRTIEGVKDRIRSLPQDINGMYNDTLARIRQLEQDDVRLALGILSWVVFSYRPLKIEEIQHSMAVDLISERFNENKMFGEESMREVCEGLVTVTDGVISLVHYTAQSFFKEKRDELFPGFHATIARTCITYLSLKALEQPDDVENQQSYADDLYDIPDPRTANEILESAKSTRHRRLSYNQKRAKFPFHIYASEFLPRHLRDLGTVSVLDDILYSLQRLLQDRPKRLFLIRTMSEYYPQLGHASRLLQQFPLAEDFVLPSDAGTISAGMISAGESDDPVPWEEVSPVLPSSPTDSHDSHIESEDQELHLSLVDESPSKIHPDHDLSRGLPPATVERETTALHLAVFLGWPPIVTHLLDSTKQQVAINAVDMDGRTPLIIAAGERHWDVVPLLLDRGASVDLLSSDGHAVLLQAAQRDRKDIVQRVIFDLMHPMIYDISHVKPIEHIMAIVIAFILEVFFLIGGYYPTYNQVRATEQRWMNRVLHLSTRRKAIDSRFGDHLRLLTGALSGDCEAIKRLVYDGRVQFESEISCFHNTAAFLAVEFDQRDAAAEILDSGANINMRGLQNCTLLHRAAYRNSIGMVQMLLDRHPTIDLKDDNGLTAWSANLDEEHNAGK